MKRIFKALLIATLLTASHKAKADFGDADFPLDNFQNSPKSYHDAWCRYIKNDCRVRFQRDAMWVEGQGGIYRSQFVRYRYDSDTQTSGFFITTDHYNYITYRSNNGELRQALFLFANNKAQQDFMKAFLRWEEGTGDPIPNYRLPNSQGPQDTQGRDDGLNPYDKPPIMDWSIKTTPEKKGNLGNINCDSPVWKNKPRCN